MILYMKYLSIDYGSKKVGIATSDDEGRMAYPCMIADNDKSLMGDIKEIVRTMKINEIVIGESVDQNGKPNEIMKEIRSFAVRLEDELDIPVHFEKEFMTSIEARRMQSQHIVDDSAAALILQRYLDKINRPIAEETPDADEDEDDE
jgi:putative holliday junction resolvase